MQTPTRTGVERWNDVASSAEQARANHATLLRDVGSLRQYFGQSAPELLTTWYGAEIYTSVGCCASTAC